MRKEDLKNEMIVEYRDGRRFMVVDKILYGINSCAELTFKNSNLTSLGLSDSDIVKVYKVIARSGLNKVLTNDDRLKLLWERQETLYFDLRKSNRFKDNFNNILPDHKERFFSCHGLTKEETKEKGYGWPNYLFSTEKPKPLKIIDGRVEWWEKMT